jgi:hypothetical protein
MPGFFQSLAAHALPSGPRIRPVASPYVRASLTTLEDVAPVPENDVLKAPAAGVRVNALDEAAPALNRQSLPTVADRVSSTRREDTSGSLQAVTQIVRATRAPVLESSSPDVTGRTVRDVPSESRAVRTVPERAAVPAPAVPAQHTPREGHLRDRTPAVVTGPGHARPRPEARPARVVQPDSGATRARDARSPDPHALPDVHIHIGRIELTAVTPAPVPRRQPQARRPAMPLDEYLRRRDGRAR